MKNIYWNEIESIYQTNEQAQQQRQPSQANETTNERADDNNDNNIPESLKEVNNNLNNNESSITTNTNIINIVNSNNDNNNDLNTNNIINNPNNNNAQSSHNTVNNNSNNNSVGQNNNDKNDDVLDSGAQNVLASAIGLAGLEIASRAPALSGNSDNVRRSPHFQNTTSLHQNGTTSTTTANATTFFGGGGRGGGALSLARFSTLNAPGGRGIRLQGQSARTQTNTPLPIQSSRTSATFLRTPPQNTALSFTQLQRLTEEFKANTQSIHRGAPTTADLQTSSNLQQQTQQSQVTVSRNEPLSVRTQSTNSNDDCGRATQGSKRRRLTLPSSDEDEEEELGTDNNSGVNDDDEDQSSSESNEDILKRNSRLRSSKIDEASKDAPKPTNSTPKKVSKSRPHQAPRKSRATTRAQPQSKSAKGGKKSNKN